MNEQINVYRLWSDPLNCDASLYSAEVKRLTCEENALLYAMLSLIEESKEQRACQQSHMIPYRQAGKKL